MSDELDLNEIETIEPIKSYRQKNMALLIMRLGQYALLITVLSVLLVIYWHQQWLSPQHLHTELELIATCLCLVIGTFALVYYYNSQQDMILLFIGIAFIGSSLFEIYHFIINLVDVTPLVLSAQSSNYAWSWLLPRLFLSFIFSLSLFFWLREHYSALTEKKWRITIYWAGCILFLILLIAFTLVLLPQGHDSHSIFHHAEEFIPGALFLIILLGYLAKGRWRHHDFEHCLILFFIVNLFVQVCMALSMRPEDPMFILAHLLMIFSHIIILIGLMRYMALGFKSALKHTSLLTQYAESLKRSNEELEQFASIASHDLKEPLRKVQAFASILHEECHQQLPAEGKDYLDRIIRSVGRMNALIEALLQYSRITRQTESFSQCNLNDVVADVVHDLDETIKENSATIDITNDLPTIYADTIQITQLLQNLITNAIKFRKPDVAPVITISGGLYHAEQSFSQQLDQFCQLTITDNGIGIEKKYTKRIFGIFQRLHGRTSRYPGSGIGLAICKRIIERHHGNISVYSNHGVGTSFTIILPVTQKSE